MSIQKKIIWMLVSCLMVLSLVMASCGPAVEEEEEVKIGEAEVEIEEEEEEEVEEEVIEEEPLKPRPETPQYGGTFNFIYRDPMGFDPKYTITVGCTASLGGFVTNEMLQGDWSKGVMGTYDTDWMLGWLGHIDLEEGSLAESWELPDEETIIFHIRKGVHFHNKPPVNGRELDADDVVWNMKRSWESPDAWNYRTWAPENRPRSIKALDKWTVEIKNNPAVQGTLFFQIAEQTHIFAKEVDDFRDWKK